MKGGSLQTRRNFLDGRGPECLGVATAHDLYRTMKISMCYRVSVALKSKYPSFFSARWVARVPGRDVTYIGSINITMPSNRTSDDRLCSTDSIYIERLNSKY